MKRSVALTIGLLLSFLILLTSVSASLASWLVQNDTVNKLTVGSVRGQIVEQYEDGVTVTPGDTVTKVVNFKNTGTVDSLLRVKIEKYWGSSRDENGNIVIDESIPTDSIHVTCNSDKWVYDDSDGYYYYIAVLTPGSMTEQSLMDSFTLDSSLDNDYAGLSADIRINMECVQAGGNGIEYWGKTLDELGIKYTPKPSPSPALSVTFNDPDSGFSFDASNGDLFVNFKELIPGETRSEVLNVGSKNNDNTEIFLRAELNNNDISPTDKAKVLGFLKDYATITITDKTGKVIYSGPVLDDADDANSMKNRLSLGVYSKNEYRDFTVSLTIDPQAGNEYAALLGEVKWIFEANGVKTAVPDNDLPYTGDTMSMSFFITTAVVSGTAFVILVYKRKKESENVLDSYIV